METLLIDSVVDQPYWRLRINLRKYFVDNELTDGHDLVRTALRALLSHVEEAKPFVRGEGHVAINVETSNLLKQAMIAIQYALTQRGPMTMAASLGTGFLKTEDHLETPDIQFHIQPWSADNPSEGPHKFSAFTASVLQLRPESAGHIELTSKARFI